MEIKHRFFALELNSDDDDKGGYYDVVTQLRDDDKVIGLTKTRIFFTDENLTIEQLKAEAPRRALNLLSQILELAEVPAIPEGLQ